MEFITYEQEGFVGVVTINRPKALNALNSQVLDELEATFDAIDLDTTRAVVLTGTGEKSFVAGADIGEMSTLTKAEGEAFGKKGNDVFRAIETFPIPVIAAVNGFALGGGCEISMSCDIRICSENAIFGQPEAGLGITPGFGGTQRLARLVGAGMAKQLIYTARNIKADEAYRIGLVNAVYPLEELLPAAKKMAAGIAAGGGKPVYGVYSTFVQRTYDQITQDLCIDSNPATIVTFWGSVYGMNDITHLGLQDIPMMSNIPNLVYLAPTTKEEYLAMLDWSIDQDQYPVAIKLPGGEMISDGKKITKDFSQLNKYEVTEKGSKVAVIGLGTFYNMGCEVAKAVEEKTGTKATVINPYYITGIDEVLLEDLKKDHDVVITLEDGFLEGGFGEKIARFYGDSDVKVLNYGVKKELLDRYDIEELLKKNHLTVQQIVGDLKF